MSKEPKKGKVTGNESWRAFFKGSYLGYYDLTEDVTLTIKEMRYEDVKGPGGRSDAKLVAYWTNDDFLPMPINTTNAKTITDLYGTNQPAQWVGKSVTLYADSSVKFAGEAVGGIRIRPVKPTMKLRTLNDGQFAKMLASIQSGKYSIEKARADFALTPDQIVKLEAVAA